MVRIAQNNSEHLPEQVSSRWYHLGRAIWAGLFLIHIVPLVSVSSKLVGGTSLNLLLSFAAIVGIMTLALLKAIDVPALRIRLSWQKWATLVVLGLFFHGDVVANKLPDIMVAESTMIVLVSIVCASRRLRHIVMKVIISTSLQLRESLYACVEELFPTPHVPVAALISSPRPPPLR